MRFQAESEIVDLVRRFEDCTYPADDFHHAEHVAIATWYLLQHERISESFAYVDESAALALFRQSLLRYAESLDAAANYHETITVFWVKAAAALLAHAPGDRLTRVNAAVERLGDKTLIERHYTKELLDSPAARASWIEPDLAPIA